MKRMIDIGYGHLIDRTKESACVPTRDQQIRMTAKYLFSLLATFDMQVGNSPYGISVRQIPKLASITMCFWLRFPAAIVIDNKSYFPMINYYVSGRQYQEFAINWYPNRDRTEPGMQVAFKTWRRNNKYLPRYFLRLRFEGLTEL